MWPEADRSAPEGRRPAWDARGRGSSARVAEATRWQQFNSIQFNKTPKARRPHSGPLPEPNRDSRPRHKQDPDRPTTNHQPRRTREPSFTSLRRAPDVKRHHDTNGRHQFHSARPNHQSSSAHRCVQLLLTPVCKLIARPGVAPPLEPLLHLRSMLQWRWQRRGHRRPAGGRGAAAAGACGDATPHECGVWMEHGSIGPFLGKRAAGEAARVLPRRRAGSAAATGDRLAGAVWRRPAHGGDATPHGSWLWAAQAAGNATRV